MRPAGVLTALFLSLAACTGGGGGKAGPASGAPASGARFGLGRSPSAAELAAIDLDVAPDGQGLPPGRGTAAAGATLYAKQCQMCHGAHGEGMAPVFPPLIGREPAGEGFPFGRDWRIPRTIGNYWPYATTVFDYVRRAMPHPKPGSLSNDEVYALTAWLLAANKVIPADATLDSASLVRVRMPYQDKFVPDSRRGGPELK